ncbi:hypothetical protein [Streptomyces sp. NPDC054837]
MPQQVPPVERAGSAAVGALTIDAGVEARIVSPHLFDWDSPWTGAGLSPYVVY